MSKISIRFFEDREVRAIWDDTCSKWWFSVPDIVGVINQQDDYAKNRNYWKYLKAKLKKDVSELVSVTTQLKLKAADGKRYMTDVLDSIERMPDATLDEIVDKYVEMNIAHPFREGNGRSTRIWLDMMLKSRLQRCVDWSAIDKNAYLAAMVRSVADAQAIRELLSGALTDRIADREMFMKGIDYSYYYEQPE